MLSPEILAFSLAFHGTNECIRFSCCFPSVCSWKFCGFVSFLLDKMFANYEKCKDCQTILQVFSALKIDFYTQCQGRTYQHLPVSEGTCRRDRGTPFVRNCSDKKKEQCVQIERGDWNWKGSDVRKKSFTVRVVETGRGVSGRLWMIPAWQCSSPGWIRAHLKLKDQTRYYVLSCPGPETLLKAQESPFH